MNSTDEVVVAVEPHVDTEEQTMKITNQQVSELFIYFTEYISRRKMSIDELIEYFAPGTETFLHFMLEMEEKFAWFDYSQADDALEILDIYLQTLDQLDE